MRHAPNGGRRAVVRDGNLAGPFGCQYMHVFRVRARASAGHAGNDGGRPDERAQAAGELTQSTHFNYLS
jgi:hypothetical protein